ncbi:MAG: SH3 domain-containing protein [Ruminococcus sp.]|nr:SH3 domain-containing protein [Ruminococcus sp.]
MKKALLYALTLALVLSLTSCGQPKTEQPTDPAPSTSVPVDTSTQEPAATPEPIKDTAPKPTEDAQPPEDGQALEEISHDELIAVFEEEYEISKNIYNSDEEEVIRSELEMIKIVVKNMDRALPSDYEAQYREWRPSVIQQTQIAAPEATLTFIDCNETVWATGTVNLRSGPSTEDDKVGSLNKNQSVTRIGIGTGDYSSWSKVKLSDGSEVYAASNYLTTTKPASQSSSKPSGGSTGSTSGGQQTQGGVIIDPETGEPLVKGSDFNKTLKDSSDLANNQDDPYSGYGEVSIGYGGK